MTDERETEVVSGTVGGIIQKATDKWQVEVTPPGSQYARKLWTKSETTRAQAATLFGQQATFECGVSEWTNQDDKPVRSLWINHIVSGNPESSAATPTAAKPREDPTRDSIEKQTALIQAVALHSACADIHEQEEVLVTAAKFFAFLQGKDVPEQPRGALPDEDIPF